MMWGYAARLTATELAFLGAAEDAEQSEQPAEQVRARVQARLIRRQRGALAVAMVLVTAHGVPAFGRPKGRNAATTLLLLGLIGRRYGARRAPRRRGIRSRESSASLPKWVRVPRWRRPASHFNACMTLSLLRNPASRLAMTGVLYGVAMLVFIAYALPFFGLFASLRLPCVTHRSPLPVALSAHSIAWSLMAWAGLWLPGLLSIFTQCSPDLGERWVGGLDRVAGHTALRPGQPQRRAASRPSGRCNLSRRSARRCQDSTWMVVIALTWLAPWVHYLVFTQIPHEFFCLPPLVPLFRALLSRPGVVEALDPWRMSHGSTGEVRRRTA